MKILIVCDHFYPEEFIINDLAAEWSNNGHEVTVLTQNPAYPKGKVYEGYKNRLFQITFWNKNDSHEPHGNHRPQVPQHSAGNSSGDIKIHRVYTVQGYRDSKKRKILNYLCFVILGTIKALSVAKKNDRIFIYQVGPLTQAIPAIIAHKFFKRKITIWTTDVWPDTVYAYGFTKSKALSYFLDKLVKLIFKHCTAILIPSEGFKKVYLKYTEESKLIYVPSWCMNKKPVIQTGFSFDGKTNFTFAGNIGKVQNLTNVILGFERALQSNKEIMLHFIGDGSFLVGLQNLIQEKNIPNVVFWGRQPYNEMDKYYEASDFLIISLDPDPVYDLYIPTKFQTYLQTGKPILSIMNGQVPDLIAQHDIGLIASPGNIDDIAEKMIQCTQMTKETLYKIKMNSNRLLETNFNREKIIETITNVLIEK